MGKRTLKYAIWVGVSLFLASAPCEALGAFPPLSDTDKWALDKIRAGEFVDLNKRCGALDVPSDIFDTPTVDKWRNDSCRALSGNILVEAVRDPNVEVLWRNRGIVIIGAYLPTGGAIKLSHP
jgi:hypothetical protein